MQNIQKKETGQLIGIIAIIAILLGIVMAVLGPGSHFGQGWSYLTGGNNQQVPASGTSIIGSPTISAQFIDQMLSSRGSPAAGTGQELYDLGVNAHIDPAFALAVFWNESNFGKAGVARDNLSLGNLRCINEAKCVGGYAAFSSWQEGYQAFYTLISGPLYAGSGLNSPESIIPKYAPSGDNNVPSHYISVVNNCMAMWRAGTVGAPA